MRMRSFLFTVALAWTLTASGSVGRIDRRAQDIAGANERVYHLIGICMAGGESVCAHNAGEFDRGLQKLETNSLSAGSATKYRQARVQIGVAHRYYAQAQTAPGRERTRLVGLGNDAMKVAKALISAALRLFESVLQSIANGQGFSGGGGDDDDPCKKGRKDREDVCERNHAGAVEDADEQRDYMIERGCRKLVDRAVAQAKADGHPLTNEEIKRLDIKCHDDAESERRRKVHEADLEKAKCMAAAAEWFERCRNGETE